MINEKNKESYTWSEFLQIHEKKEDVSMEYLKSVIEMVKEVPISILDKIYFADSYNCADCRIASD